MKQMDEVKQMAFMLNETEEDFIRRAISNELKKAKIAFNDYVTVDENEYNYTIKSSHIDRFSKILNFHDSHYFEISKIMLNNQNDSLKGCLYHLLLIDQFASFNSFNRSLLQNGFTGLTPLNGLFPTNFEIPASIK